MSRAGRVAWLGLITGAAVAMVATAVLGLAEATRLLMPAAVMVVFSGGGWLVWILINR
jgi:hypothetical protein